MTDRWIKQPGPGQFRGEGEWVEYLGTDDEWEWLRGTGFLPTAEGEKPNDQHTAIEEEGRMA